MLLKVNDRLHRRLVLYRQIDSLTKADINKLGIE